MSAPRPPMIARSYAWRKFARPLRTFATDGDGCGGGGAASLACSVKSGRVGSLGS